MSSCILNDVWVSTGEIVPLCGAEEPLVAGKKTSNAHVGGDEMESEMFWEIGKKKEEEGLKVSTKFFSVVSKFACSYMNLCTIRCCFRERITAAELQTFSFFYTMSPFWGWWAWCGCETQRLYQPKHHRKRLERDLSVNLNGIVPLWAESSSPQFGPPD